MTRAESVSSWVINWSISAFTVGGVASQSLSEMPAGGGSISGSLWLRSKLFSEVCQERNCTGAFFPPLHSYQKTVQDGPDLSSSVPIENISKTSMIEGVGLAQNPRTDKNGSPEIRTQDQSVKSQS